MKRGFPSQATPNGEGLMFLSYGAFAGAQSASLPDAYVSRRSAAGWGTVNVSPPNPDPTPPGGDPVAYQFSPDLSQWVVQVPLQQLAEGADSEVANLFQASGSGAAGTYSWINNGPPAVPLPEGCPFPELQVACWQLVDLVAFAGVSDDFQHVIFEGQGSLVPGAPAERENLYQSDYEDGRWRVSLVGMLPDGLPAAEGSTAGSGSSVYYTSAGTSADNRVANAISADGTHVVFQAASDEGEPGEAGQAGLTQVYARIDGTQTVELSAPAEGAAPANPAPAPATFWAASHDGSRVFFTSSAELTTPSNTGPANEGADLYEYDLADETLTDLTVESTDPAGAGVLGVLGASADGSYVYFAARGQLVSGEGEAGKPNLYMVHDGAPPVFIATLSETDGENWSQTAALLESYVTPDGGHLAFTSHGSLPTANFPGGYDNVNEATGEAEREVYEFSAAGGGLVCASCNPTGVAPIGPGLLAGAPRPGGEGGSTSSPFHPVRAVSANGGRVFFNSPDALVPGARATTKAKVYEYERDGEGSCQETDGCVYLLSSPSSPEEAIFLDADESGENVFFATSSRLASSDRDDLTDVYDARQDGGLAEPPPSPPCESIGEGEGCRGAGTAAPAGGAAATHSFQGPGNVPHKPGCRAGKVRRHQRCVRRHHRHHRRRHHRHNGREHRLPGDRGTRR